MDALNRHPWQQTASPKEKKKKIVNMSQDEIHRRTLSFCFFFLLKKVDVITTVANGSKSAVNLLNNYADR